MAVLDCKEKKTASVDSKIEFKVFEDESKIQKDERETEYDSGSVVENECEADANNGKWDCDSDAYVSEEEIPQPNYPVTCIKDKELPSEKCRSPNNMQIQHASPDLADFEQYGVEKKKQSTKSEVNDMQQELSENRTCITLYWAKDQDAGTGGAVTGKEQQNDELWKFSSEDKAEGVNIEPCEGMVFAREIYIRMQERMDAYMLFERRREREIICHSVDILLCLELCGRIIDSIDVRTFLVKAHPLLVENLNLKDCISKLMEEEENSKRIWFPMLCNPWESQQSLNKLILQEVMRRGKSMFKKFKTYLNKTGLYYLSGYISDFENRFCNTEFDNTLKIIQDDPQKIKRETQTVVTENRWVRFEGEPLTKVQQTKKIRQLSLPGRGQADGDSGGNPVPQDVEWGQLKQEEAKSCSLSSAISRLCNFSNASDGSEEIISVTKQPKWTPFSCGMNVKRKNTVDDKTMKRRRIGGVISRPLDGDFDYCELIQAFSLHTKRHINSALVNFLCDLLFLLRKYSIGRMMKTSFYTFTDDDMDDIKEVFVQQECFLAEASKSVHKGELLDYVGEDAEYALPGIDYEIHLPLMEKSLDENITKKSLSNDTMLIKKANQQDEEEHILDISEPYRAELAFKIEVLNEEVSQTLEDDRPDEEEQTSAKLVNAAAASEQLEQVNSEKCDNVGAKVTKIQMQVIPSNFASQSDVSSVSAENLQEALTSTMNAQETFRNLKYKVHNPIPQKEVPEKVDNFGRGKNMKKFLLPEDREEAVYEDLVRNLPQPIIDTALLTANAYFSFEPIMAIIDQIANGTPPTPHISMRYELLRFCTLRSYPKGDKPYLIKLAEAGFYYASDGDGVVCYCCGTRRYNWTAEDNPWKIHERINPNCKFLRKNDEVNVPVKYFGPFSKSLMYIMDIPEPIERTEVSEDVNNDWAPERTRSPAPQQNRPNESSANALGINTALPKHTQYATKTAREASFNAWPDTASHTPEILADAGFFYAGFGDCVRCFYCGIGLRHWTQDDDPWIEHARWSKNCVFVKQKKGEEFVNLVQLAIQYSNDNEAGQPAAGAGNQLPVQEIERILLSDAAQSVLEMGYQPRIIKKAIEQILRQNGNAKITAQVLMEKVLEMEEAENSPQAAPVPTVEASAKAKPASQTAVSEVEKAGEAKSDAEKKPNDNAKSSLQSKDKDKNEKASRLTSKESSDEASSQDPKAIKAENEQLKEQTLCKVCLDNTVCIVFLPCGHLVTCADCAPAMRKCPICRALVKGTVRTYMS